MFHSETREDQGTADPDEIRVEVFDDPGEFDGEWLHVIWSGDQYEDAWFIVKTDDVEDLDKNE